MNAGLMLLKSMGLDPELIKTEMEKILSQFATAFKRVETKIDETQECVADLKARMTALETLLNKDG